MITDAKDFNVSKMVFLKEKTVTLSQRNTSLKKIPIKVMLNQKLVPLLIATEKCFSWGIKKDTTLKLPIVVTNKELTTDGQKTFLETIEKIIQACKQHCLENGIYNVEKMGSCLYVKKGVENYPPTLYAKVPEQTIFYEMKNVTDVKEGGKEVDPNTLIGKRMHVKALLQIDNIYVSEECVSLQIRTREVNFSEVPKPIDVKKLMSNAVAAPRK